MEVPKEQRDSVLRAVCEEQGIPMAATTVQRDGDVDGETLICTRTARF